MGTNTFTGEFRYSIDAKGRLNIPAKFRKALP
ncbi:MAG: MraZ N-terminal domain containing protein, partial [Candidatus Marinimicrobia bacterium]|nr:MraZ N-terminal domain containing protein [Candidatus Neomarinimicrobiota bacterium]